MTLTMASIGDQYSLRIPAQRFRQGDRDVFSFALDLGTLNGLLPQRIDEDVVKDANRRLTLSHAKKIQRYLIEQSSKWVLGSILLGIAPDAVKFEGYPDESGTTSECFGELKIRSSKKDTMKIFDGQHRRRAIADAIKELEGDQRKSDHLEALRTAAVPVVLYVEADLKALRQMFTDASKTKPIESNTVTRFDERDAFNLAAKHVAENSNLFAGRVEMERTTVRGSSECLVAINQLAATLKTVDVGYSGRVRRERNDDYMLDLDALFDRFLTWADDFMPAAREEYDNLIAGETDNSDIPKLRPDTFAFSAPVIRILAGCYHEWIKSGDDPKHLADFIRHASLQPGKGNGEGSLLVEAGVVTPGGTTPVPRAQEVKGAINYIVASAKAANQ